MENPLPPLLVAEGYALTLFRSERTLGRYLEPWYVEGDYRAWDGLGRALELVVIEEPPPSGLIHRLRSSGPRVAVRLRDSGDSAEECATYLRDWLTEIGGPTLPPTATLSDLLVQAMVHGDIE